MGKLPWIITPFTCLVPQYFMWLVFFRGRGMGAEGSDFTMPWIPISSSYTWYVLGKHYYVSFKNYSVFHYIISWHHFHTKKTIVCMSNTSAVVKIHQTKFPTNFNHFWGSRNIHKEIRNRQEITERARWCTWKSEPLERTFLQVENNGLWWLLFLQLGW